MVRAERRHAVAGVARTEALVDHRSTVLPPRPPAGFFWLGNPGSGELVGALADEGMYRLVFLEGTFYGLPGKFVMKELCDCREGRRTLAQLAGKGCFPRRSGSMHSGQD
jgi:hypothetical protein